MMKVNVFVGRGRNDMPRVKDLKPFYQNKIWLARLACFFCLLFQPIIIITFILFELGSEMKCIAIELTQDMFDGVFGRYE